MRRFLTSAAKLIGGFAGGCAISLLAITSFERNCEFSAREEIQAIDNITVERSIGEQRAILRSRQSAVNVMSMASDSPVVSSASGTYLTLEGRYYILTVHHTLVGPCDSVRIAVDDELYDCLKYVVVDPYVDYALMQVEEIAERVPLHMPRSMPRSNEWDREIATQTRVFYTGYPNGLGPLTFNGSIIGHDELENIFIHSFAWPGSSGAGVFNERGKFIGYAMAINVGVTEYGIDVLEDIVIVVPLFRIDWQEIDQEVKIDDKQE
jgi:hypothetical protein